MATQASPLAATRNRRVLVVVALAAAVAAAAVVGATLLQTRGERTTVPGLSGQPPLELDLQYSVAAGPETQTLRRAEALYDDKHAAQAAVLFARYHSPAARIGAAFAAWPNGNGLHTLQQLAAQYPRSALAALHLGWAYYWSGRNSEAVVAWRLAARLGTDSPYGVSAEDILHSALKAPAGLPPIVMGRLAPPAAIAKLPAAQELAALRRAAEGPDVRAELLYGYTLWSLERPVSAEREFAAAARLAPQNALARTAAAVGLFSKAHPVRVFAQLGPLTAVFPRSPVVEFHLGVLLLYIDKPAKAAEHLRAARADGPHSAYAQPAATLLTSLARTRSK